jgi:hypothetical protein
VGGAAFGDEFEPEIAFMSGDDLEFGRFADDGEVTFNPGFRKGAGTFLAVFFVDEAQEENFGVCGAVSAVREGEKRGEHGGDAAFGIASAASEEAAIFGAGLEGIGADGVEMWGEDEALANFAGGFEAEEEIGAAGFRIEDRLKIDGETGFGGEAGDEVSDAPFAGAGIIWGHESWIDAGESDQISKQRFWFRHHVCAGV